MAAAEERARPPIRHAEAFPATAEDLGGRIQANSSPRLRLTVGTCRLALTS